MVKVLDYTIERKHNDIKVLADALTKYDIEFEDNYDWIDGKIVHSGYPSLRGSSSHKDGITREGNYIRVRHLKYWDDASINELEVAIDYANKHTKEYVFEFGSVSDYEVDIDDDRSWDASFTFYSHKK
tara:strand:- start:167 stop:550 length:384 start_codon:yes stop_codon:yes gene_type:complete